jgi:hypothetical protein
MIKKLLFVAVTFFLAATALGQTNLQLHYDYGRRYYGNDLKDRPEVTLTFEDRTNFDFGISSYFYLDANLSNNRMVGAYTEVSVDKSIFKFPVSAHIEYNGGLQTNLKGINGYAYNDAYLGGLAFHGGESGNTFTMQCLYRYMTNHPSEKSSFQVTALWNYYLFNGFVSFNGFMDVWRDKEVEGDVVFLTEPQLWFNLYALIEGLNLSVGGEMEVSYNYLKFTDGSRVKENRLGVCPTIAAKWTF